MPNFNAAYLVVVVAVVSPHVWVLTIKDVAVPCVYGGCAAQVVKLEPS